MENLVRNILLQRTSGVADRVRGLGIFRGINPEEVQLFLADKGTLVTFTPGASIIQQSRRTPGVYLLVRGSVILRQEIADERVSPLELYDKPLDHGLFGERSVITGQGAVCSAVASDEVTMLHIPKKDFTRLLHEQPQLLRNCLENMGDYIESSDERGSLASRLAGRLSEDQADSTSSAQNQ
jgi:CRP-like cAMP-binding protein